MSQRSSLRRAARGGAVGMTGASSSFSSQLRVNGMGRSVVFHAKAQRRKGRKDYWVRNMFSFCVLRGFASLREITRRCLHTLHALLPVLRKTSRALVQTPGGLQVAAGPRRRLLSLPQGLGPVGG